MSLATPSSCRGTGLSLISFTWHMGQEHYRVCSAGGGSSSSVQGGGGGHLGGRLEEPHSRVQGQDHGWIVPWGAVWPGSGDLYCSHQRVLQGQRWSSQGAGGQAGEHCWRGLAGEAAEDKRRCGDNHETPAKIKELLDCELREKDLEEAVRKWRELRSCKRNIGEDIGDFMDRFEGSCLDLKSVIPATDWIEGQPRGKGSLQGGGGGADQGEEREGRRQGKMKKDPCLIMIWADLIKEELFSLN